MLRTLLIAIALAVAPLAAVTDASAEKISTRSCSPASDRNMTKDGKNYSCTSCETCKTTTCDVGGTANCSVKTETSCSCTEVASNPSRTQGTTAVGGTTGTLDPGSRNPTRKPQLFNAPGVKVLKKQ